MGGHEMTTALRERAEGLVAKWKLHDIYDTEEVDNARLIARIESTLRAVVEACAQVAEGYAEAAKQLDVDGPYSFKTSKRRTAECIAQAIREKGGAD